MFYKNKINLQDVYIRQEKNQFLFIGYKIFIFLFFFLIVSHSIYSISLTIPDFTTLDTTNVEACSAAADFDACVNTAVSSAITDYIALATTSMTTELDDMFSDFEKAFSSHYGDAILLGQHLSGSLGNESLGGFPGFLVGFGVGGALANSAPIIDSTDELPVDDMPTTLPAISMSSNVGFGINDKWNVYISYFPSTDITFDLDGMSVAINLGLIKSKVGYYLKKSSFGGVGIFTSGYISYASGGISLTTDPVVVDSVTGTDSSSSGTVTSDFSYTVDPTYQIKSTIDWKYFGFGGEIKVWFNLKYFFPFMGLALGFQNGYTSTAIIASSSLGIDGDVHVVNTAPVVDETSNVTQDTQFDVTVRENAYSSFYSARFLLGFEIRLFFLSINVETQVAAGSRLLGLATSFAFKF